MSSKLGLSRPGKKTSLPICCGVGAGTARLVDNRSQQIHVECSRQFDAVHEQVIGAQREIFRDQIFGTGVRLLAIWRRHAWVKTKDRWCDCSCWSRQWAALRSREEICCCTSIRYLLECLQTILFDRPRQVGENIAEHQATHPAALGWVSVAKSGQHRG